MEKITDKIKALPNDANYFSLEFFPPKTSAGWVNLQARLERMSRALRPFFVNVTWGAGGSTATKSLELAELCQQQLGLTTCLHLTCTNMNKSLIDHALEKAKAIGVRNILALRGDPPRNEEYFDKGELEEESTEFVWAVDLVKYIRKKYGDYFCIGVAAYPEGHADSSHPERQDPLFDLPYLIEKTKAGADFIMTQLFFDVHAYEKFEDMLRTEESGVFKDIPIIPGLMPIQSYQILRRTTKLSHASLPADIMKRLDAVKGDDEAVKAVGVDILCEIIGELQAKKSVGPRGFHFYTLNLEKTVSQIIERCHLLKVADDDDEDAIEIVEELSVTNGAPKPRKGRVSSAHSDPHNRVIVGKISGHRNSVYETLEKDAGLPSDTPTRATTLAISEGEGSMGREATWDDFPNGRWGDARSPAFGEIDGYGVSLHVSIPQAIKMWGHPVTVGDISDIFRKHISGELAQIPWSEEGLSQETGTITNELLTLNKKGWWTVASQPAVNGLKSSHEIFGWGPRNGFVFQKPFVEFFLPAADWTSLKKKLEQLPDEITYFAGNAHGDFESSDLKSVNPVTWGTFPGKEIITPTIIEAVSFRAWLEEAFSIWREWQHIYPPKSATAKLLGDIRNGYWLVNVICHEYRNKDLLWTVLGDE
ncbi:methylenetetrahydrofolate reductase [Verruconis gallopava]|uniref:Methylenetetrahydrofolate reductase n=1 Tax=Verruconis gallopava TaxID=253628 RepID=A0A0D2AK67_9PEZI|nr:methylenetetrahydrofolate reductase [Verruconis gallopava]KIW07243.1 methylenetetrahydrofolate reductase [Verruconis gallopava]